MWFSSITLSRERLGGRYSQFQPTEMRLTVNGQAMNVFERRVRNGESLTLGSNTEDRRLKSSNMYIVFVKALETVKRAGS